MRFVFHECGSLRKETLQLKGFILLENGETLNSIERICEASFHGGLSMEITYAILSAELPRDGRKN